MMLRMFMKAMLATALFAVASTSTVQASAALVADLTPAAVETRLLVEATSAPAPTPAASTLKKKKKKSKKCESGLEPLPEDLEAERAADIESAVKTPDNSTSNALSLSAEAEAAEAPAVPIGESTTTERANTKSNGAESTGLGGGVVAIIVAAGVMAVAAAAVALRSRAEERRRSNTLRTPVENFGQVNATPAQVTIL